MKFFADTASLKEIKELAEWGLVDGVTTNPTLLSKEEGDPLQILRGICEVVNGPVSAEVVALDHKGMLEEGRRLAKMHPNITIKVPITLEGLRAVRGFAQEGIRTNVTLTFSSPQALLAAKAGATFVSPFVGRLDDGGWPGMDLIREIVTIYQNYAFKTEVIVASVRNPLHVVEAALAGAHVVTIPPSVMRTLVKHPLTDQGIERFLADWKKLGVKI